MEIQAPCPGCGDPVTFEAVFKFGNQTCAPHCEICAAKQKREDDRRIAEAVCASAWNRICPSRFQDTKFEQLPCQDKSAKALAWPFNGGQGLNLWGKPDTGKTRSMFLIVEKFYRQGKTVAVFNPTDFCAELERRGFARATWASRISKRDIVAFDDMDKLSLTRPQENTFFGILDKRMTAKLPCIFTHNSTSEELTYRFKNGEALVKRIRNYTMSLHFP